MPLIKLIQSRRHGALARAPPPTPVPQEDINKGMTPAGAAAKEMTFFQQDPFFGSEAVAGMADHFGVDALRVQLSKQLVSLTQRELPNMKAALEEVLEQVGVTYLKAHAGS